MAYVLIGESASGKTTIERMLSVDLGLDRIVSYTTRPQRDGEIDGVDYNFVSENYFVKKMSQGFFAESVKYRDWLYGIAKEDIKDDSLVIVEPTGLRQLLKLEELNIVSFYIKADIRTRIKRMLDRGDEIMEVFRRAISDGGSFNNIENEVDYIIENEDGMIREALKNIKDIIGGRDWVIKTT